MPEDQTAAFVAYVVERGYAYQQEVDGPEVPTSEIPDWHRKIVEERIANRTDKQGMPWDEFKQEMNGLLDRYAYSRLRPIENKTK